jgi:hypothetical protein
VEQLPPYPEPSHRGKRSNPNLPKGKQLHVTVDFLSEARRKAALPMVRPHLASLNFYAAKYMRRNCQTTWRTSGQSFVKLQKRWIGNKN